MQDNAHTNQKGFEWFTTVTRRIVPGKPSITASFDSIRRRWTQLRERLRAPGSRSAAVETDADTLCAIIGNERRRYVIYELRADTALSIRTLADRVAEREFDVDDSDSLSSGERKRVYVSLYQAHLETMDEAGAIVWDDRIHPGPRFADFDWLLETIETATGGDSE